MSKHKPRRTDENRKTVRSVTKIYDYDNGIYLEITRYSGTGRIHVYAESIQIKHAESGRIGDLSPRYRRIISNDILEGLTIEITDGLPQQHKSRSNAAYGKGVNNYDKK